MLPPKTARLRQGGQHFFRLVWIPVPSSIGIAAGQQSPKVYTSGWFLAAAFRGAMA
jgi:hypothetical protein